MAKGSAGEFKADTGCIGSRPLIDFINWSTRGGCGRSQGVTGCMEFLLLSAEGEEANGIVRVGPNDFSQVLGKLRSAAAMSSEMTKRPLPALPPYQLLRGTA